MIESPGGFEIDDAIDIPDPKAYFGVWCSTGRWRGCTTGLIDACSGNSRMKSPIQIELIHKM